MKMPGSGMTEGILANAAQGPDALQRRLQEDHPKSQSWRLNRLAPAESGKSAGSKPENERSKWMRSDFLS